MAETDTLDAGPAEGDPGRADPELAAEQAHLEHAHACLEAMRTRAESLVGQSEDPDLEAALARRVRLLADDARALCFGRIDTEGGDTFHIGRRHVEDSASDPVVVEWRTPVAVPFYRASLSEPLGLTRRRQFVVDRRTILSMADDLFGPDAATTGDPRVRGRDALLAELERQRTGEMLDIVATIQAEQDEVIRAELEGVLVVQGGPGTGKTAIGLHRAAYLLYAHPEVARQGMLVIGPTRTFIRYIAMVLPSLGEEAVVQTTLVDLVPQVTVRAEDEPAVARLKGDPRMARVLARALEDRRRPPEGDLVLAHGLFRTTVPAGDLASLLEALGTRNAPYGAGRTALRDRMTSLAHRHHRQVAGMSRAAEARTFARAVAADPAFRQALDHMWPAVSAPALVAELLSSPSRLARASEGVLSSDEQALLLRPPATMRRQPWTEADAVLVDEAVNLVSGQARTYAHVVVDEAQDLSPMQRRMIARRCPAGSITVLGDLAQGSGVWAVDDWDEVVDDLPTPDGRRHQELTLGYRAPGQVLALASRLLPVIAPGVTPTESIRPGRTAPVIREVGRALLAGSAAAEAADLRSMGSVGVLVGQDMLAEVDAALAAAGVEHAGPDGGSIAAPVVLLPAAAAKGLEFDAVVVVEPAGIVEDAPRGLRLLYVAMTRPTKHLSIVHHRPLPGMFAA
ncbi:MAG TPA: AAA family ATPase [Acidimicrobiales bacterium]|nr:AAA family ATPase [Acidimicrobiales bacterium]